MRALIERCVEEWGSDGWTVRGLIEGCGEEWGMAGWNVGGLIERGAGRVGK